MGGIITNLIGQGLGQKQQSAQQDAQDIGQQLQMFNYVLRDPDAPIPLKDIAHQKVLGLVQKHGGKQAREALPQLGQYLTQLAAPSIMQGMKQRQAASQQQQQQGQAPMETMPDTPNVAPTSQPTPNTPPELYGNQFRAYYQQSGPPGTPPEAKPSPFPGQQPRGLSAPPAVNTAAGQMSPEQAGQLLASMGQGTAPPVMPPPSEQYGRLLASLGQGVSPPAMTPPEVGPGQVPYYLQQPPTGTPPLLERPPEQEAAAGEPSAAPGTRRTSLAQLADYRLPPIDIPGPQGFKQKLGNVLVALSGQMPPQAQLRFQAMADRQRMMDQARVNLFQQQQTLNFKLQQIDAAEQQGLLTTAQAEEARRFAIVGERQTAAGTGGEIGELATAAQWLQSGTPAQKQAAQIYINEKKKTGAAGKLTGQAAEVASIDAALASDEYTEQQKADLGALKKKITALPIGQQEMELDKQDVQSLSDMLQRGELDPRLTGVTRRGKQMVEAELGRRGINLKQMQMDQEAAYVWLHTQNNFQMQRIMGAINTTAGMLNRLDNPENPGDDMIGKLEETLKAAQHAGLRDKFQGPYKAVNHVFLEAAANGLFESLVPGSTKAATELTAQVRDIQEELAVVMMGGTGPTDKGLEFVQSQINKDWDAGVLRDIARNTRTNLLIRQQSLRTVMPEVLKERSQQQQPGGGGTLFGIQTNKDGLRAATTQGEVPTPALVRAYVAFYSDPKKSPEENQAAVKKALQDAGYGDPQPEKK